MGFVKVFVAIAVLLFSVPVYGLLTNYQKARKIGLPIFITPVSAFHPIWSIFGPFIFPIMRIMPYPFSHWAYYGNPFWQFPDKNKSAAKFGPAWTMVTPGGLIVNLHDAQAGDELLSRTKSFLKPPFIYQAIEFYGPNVDTVNGETWQRHRRLTTPPFNEKNSALVWKESLGQAKDMLAVWEKKGEDNGKSMSDDTMKLALHVLSGAGFGKSYGVSGGLTTVPEGHSLSYRDALAFILKNMLATIVTSKIKAPNYLLPKWIREMRIALVEFKKYMVEMVEEERALVAEKGRHDQKENLMSVLVRANEYSTAEGKGRSSLTDEEIYGNLFIWNLAGHDTTATVLAYTISLLAVNLPVQEWLNVEIDRVFGDAPIEKSTYEDAFPKLNRCLALMYETLRLYGPVTGMIKYTADRPQTLAIQGREHNFPPECQISLNLVSLHTNPRSWGRDALTWKPARFIEITDNEETLITPLDGSFQPWVSGPRVCPGKKFAQVEFVATISTLFRNNRVKAESLAGETPEQTKKRVLDVVEDSDVGLSPTLKMRHPERIQLRWEQKI